MSAGSPGPPARAPHPPCALRARLLRPRASSSQHPAPAAPAAARPRSGGQTLRVYTSVTEQSPCLQPLSQALCRAAPLRPGQACGLCWLGHTPVVPSCTCLTRSALRPVFPPASESSSPGQPAAPGGPRTHVQWSDCPGPPSVVPWLGIGDCWPAGRFPSVLFPWLAAQAAGPAAVTAFHDLPLGSHHVRSSFPAWIKVPRVIRINRRLSTAY